MRQSPVCIDANIVVWSLVPFPMSDKAKELLEDAQAKRMSLVAPTLLAFEVTSVLRRLVYLRALTSDEGEQAFEAFSRIPIRLAQSKGGIALAWQLARRFNRPRAYDTAYLAVALIYGCELWTADERLYNAVQTRLPWVKWLGDYASS